MQSNKGRTAPIPDPAWDFTDKHSNLLQLTVWEDEPEDHASLEQPHSLDSLPLLS